MSAALATLAYCSKIDINTEAPSGCTIITVSDKCEVHLLLKGLIDPEKEIAKMEKKLVFLGDTKAKLDQSMAAADYATKVPAEVQAANSEKLMQTTNEIQKLEIAMDALKLMK